MQKRAQVEMQIVHELLPWKIMVRSHPGTVITVEYLLFRIYSQLNGIEGKIFDEDFLCEYLDEKDRRDIYESFRRRCRRDEALRVEGMKKLDFLNEYYIFNGLKKDGDLWVMKLKKGEVREPQNPTLTYI